MTLGFLIHWDAHYYSVFCISLYRNVKMNQVLIFARWGNF